RPLDPSQTSAFLRDLEAAGIPYSPERMGDLYRGRIVSAMRDDLPDYMLRQIRPAVRARYRLQNNPTAGDQLLLWLYGPDEYRDIMRRLQQHGLGIQVPADRLLYGNHMRDHAMPLYRDLAAELAARAGL